MKVFCRDCKEETDAIKIVDEDNSLILYCSRCGGDDVTTEYTEIFSKHSLAWRAAVNIAYENDPEFIEIYNKIYEFANKFHRAEECGFLEKR